MVMRNTSGTAHYHLFPLLRGETEEVMTGFRPYVVAAALVACVLGASHVGAEEKPEYSGFLEDYSKLQSKPGTGMIYNYTYVKPDTDFASYNKFLIDAITIFPNSAAKFKGINALECGVRAPLWPG
jgi:hypothetical protein